MQNVLGPPESDEAIGVDYEKEKNVLNCRAEDNAMKIRLHNGRFSN